MTLLAYCELAFEECPSGYLQIKNRFDYKDTKVFTHEELMECMKSEHRVGLFNSRGECLMVNTSKQWDTVFGLEV